MTPPSPLLRFLLLAPFVATIAMTAPTRIDSKTSLVRILEDLNYGVKATPADHQRIEELVQSLISSRTPRVLAPVDAFFRSSFGYGRESPAAEGNWTLLYTNGPDVTGIGKIPGVKLTYVGQKVDSGARLITNYVNVSGVLADTSQEVYVNINKRNSTALDLDFDSTRIKVRKVFGSSKFLGRSVDEWKPIEFKIDKEQFRKSLERSNRSPPFFNILYLDNDLRIQRTGEGYLFVISKQISRVENMWSLEDGVKRLLGILGVVPYVIFAIVALKDFLNYDSSFDFN